MVAGKTVKNKAAQNWSEARLKLLTAVRRSISISAGGKHLWTELAFGWAWYEPACFPTCATLAMALSTTERSVFRLLDELEDIGLIKRVRQRYGNRYMLVSTIPSKLQTDLLDNKKIAKMVAAKGLKAFEDAHHEPGPRVMNVTPLKQPGRSRHDEIIRSDVMISSGDSSRCDDFIRSDVMISSPKVDEGKYRNEEREIEEGEAPEREPAAHADGLTLGMTNLLRASRGNEGSEVMSAAAFFSSGDPLPTPDPVIAGKTSAPASPVLTSFPEKTQPAGATSSPKDNPQPPSRPRTADSSLVSVSGARGASQNAFEMSGSSNSPGTQPAVSGEVTGPCPLIAWAAAHAEIEPEPESDVPAVVKARRRILSAAARQLWSAWTVVSPNPGGALTKDGMLRLAADIGEQGPYAVASMLRALIAKPWSVVGPSLVNADPKADQPGGPFSWSSASLRDLYALPDWRRVSITSALSRLAAGETIAPPKTKDHDPAASRGVPKPGAPKPKFIFPVKQ